MKLLTLPLPYPPGFNASYRAAVVKGQAVYYKTKKAKDWQSEATELIVDAMTKAGIAPQGGRPFCWFAVYKLKSQRLDADAPVKLLHDAIRDAIGVDDNRLAAFTGSKQIAVKRVDQAFQVWIAGREVTDDSDFSVISESFVDDILLTLDALTRRSQ